LEKVTFNRQNAGRWTVLLALFFLLSYVSGCSNRWHDRKYGQKLMFNGGKLYYTMDVTAEQANKLGNYLVQIKYFDGSRVSVQLNKADKTYQVRFVVKPGGEQNQQAVEEFKHMGLAFSPDVFDSAPVVIHLCDDQFKTLRVVEPVGM
jgi:hypothetical protein